MSLRTVAELLDSEVATMKYIKLNSSIPVPDVFSHRCDYEKSAGYYATYQC